MMTKMGQQLLGMCTRKRPRSNYHYQKLGTAEGGEGSAVSVTRKLMLGALLWGLETANNFMQLNVLPVSSTFLCQLNVLPVSSVFLYQLNVLPVSSVFLYQLNVLPVSSTFLCPLNVLPVSSVFLCQLNVLPVSSTFLCQLNVLPVSSVFLYQLNVLPVSSVFLYQLNVLPVSSTFLCPLNVLPVSSVFLYQLNVLPVSSTFLCQLNVLPVLQLLGMPLFLSSLVPLVSGPLSVLLLSFMGWLTDRGSNPQCRKIAVTILVSGILMLGMVCVLAANMIHLNQLYENVDVCTNASSVVVTTPVYSDCENNTGSSIVVGTEGGLGQFGKKNESRFQEILVTESCGNDKTFFMVPFKAMLAMLGFVLIDVGFDGTSSFTKVYIATCSPVSERASALVVGMIMASAGGLFMSLLGMADMTSFLGPPFAKGGSGSLKVAMEAILVVVSVLVGLPITLLTGRAIRASHTDLSVSLAEDDHQHDHTLPNQTSRLPYWDQVSVEDNPGKHSPHHVDLFDTRGPNGTLTLNEEEKRIVNGASSLVEIRGDIVNPFKRVSYVEEIRENGTDFIEGKVKVPLGINTHLCGITGQMLDSPPSPENERVQEDIHLHFNQKSLRKITANEEAKNFEKETEPYGRLSIRHDSTGNGGPAMLLRHTEKSAPLKTTLEKETERMGEKAKDKRTCCKRGVKVRIALIMVSTCLTVGMAFLFSVGISDYVAKAIYLGDPDAEPGTDSHVRYQEGLKVASRGFAVHYAAYILFNLLNPHLLSVLGYRLEFFLVQFSTAGTMVILALTARLEVFFVLAALAGMHRVTFHVLPFAAATHILKTADPESRQVGFVISLIAAAIPLGDCILVAWLGPVEQLTGVVSSPLWMGATCGCLSALAFFFVGPVE
ncbi:hypothetical protein ACOMHN_042616 [Nucella lapillus]